MLLQGTFSKSFVSIDFFLVTWRREDNQMNRLSLSKMTITFFFISYFFLLQVSFSFRDFVSVSGEECKHAAVSNYIFSRASPE